MAESLRFASTTKWCIYFLGDIAIRHFCWWQIWQEPICGIWRYATSLKLIRPKWNFKPTQSQILNRGRIPAKRVGPRSNSNLSPLKIESHKVAVALGKKCGSICHRLVLMLISKYAQGNSSLTPYGLNVGSWKSRAHVTSRLQYAS